MQATHLDASDQHYSCLCSIKHNITLGVPTGSALLGITFGELTSTYQLAKKVSIRRSRAGSSTENQEKQQKLYKTCISRLRITMVCKTIRYLISFPEHMWHLSPILNKQQLNNLIHKRPSALMSSQATTVNEINSCEGVDGLIYLDILYIKVSLLCQFKTMNNCPAHNSAWGTVQFPSFTAKPHKIASLWFLSWSHCM